MQTLFSPVCRLNPKTLWRLIYPRAYEMLRSAIILVFCLPLLKHLRRQDSDIAKRTVRSVGQKTGTLICIDYSKNKVLVEWLDTTYPRRESGREYVICHSTAEGWKPWASLSGPWRSALRAAGLNENAHSFREVRHLGAIAAAMKRKGIAKVRKPQ